MATDTRLKVSLTQAEAEALRRLLRDIIENGGDANAVEEEGSGFGLLPQERQILSRVLAKLTEVR
jgi:hypothetical protein